MRKNIIEVEKVYHNYRKEIKEPGLWGSIKRLVVAKKREVKALSDISFTIEEGDIVGLIGHNGAGKTTLLKILSGLIQPTQGRIHVLGDNPFQRKRSFLKKISFVSGNKNQLWWDLPPLDSYELLRTIYHISGDKYQAVLDELVPLLKVEHLLDTPLRKASLGERMKLELIGALLHSPQLVFLDEPTIGLDIVSRRDIETFLIKYCQKHQAALIITSHLIEDIERVCDRIIWLNQGEKVFDGSLEEVANLLPDQKIVLLKTRSDQPDGLWKKHGHVVKRSPQTVSFLVDVEKIEGFLSGIYRELGGEEVVDVNIQPRPLVDVIHDLFQQF